VAAAFLLAIAGAASLPGCASSEEATTDEAAAPVVARDVAASELARELGLRLVPGGDRVTLESVGGGARILLFPGSRVATVAGRMLELRDEVTSASGEIWVSAGDAGAIRTTWRTEASADGVRVPSSYGSAARVPIPAAPSSVGAPAPRAPARGPSGLSDNRPTPAEVAAWSVPIRRRWQYIVVHHSASPTGNASQIDRWHRDRGMDGLGYNFVIGNGTGSADGAIEVGYRWKQQLVGAHARANEKSNYWNEVGIGICLVGDFTRTRPTPAQMRSLDRLCTFLAQYCGIPASGLRLHEDVKSTECPGKLFPRDFAIRLPGSGARTATARDGHHP
jgi:hypothetical protein